MQGVGKPINLVMGAGKLDKLIEKSNKIEGIVGGKMNSSKNPFLRFLASVFIILTVITAGAISCSALADDILTNGTLTNGTLANCTLANCTLTNDILADSEGDVEDSKGVTASEGDCDEDNSDDIEAAPAEEVCEEATPAEEVCEEAAPAEEVCEEGQ